MVRIAIDIGGTFTDIVAETAAGLASEKVLTDAAQPENAAIGGLERLLDRLSLAYGDITSIVHGTTLATNALIERRGARTALITTAGFRDVLDMRYEKRFEQYALDVELPEPLVPRPLRFGLSERILADGSVLVAPSDDEIDAMADTLRASGVEAVAIGFLHSYKNPAHERRVAERLGQRLGDSVTICQSSEVSAEIREYERFSTVCANAYVRPLMARYLTRMRATLQDRGFNGSFLAVLSDGALTTLEQAVHFPIRLVEGGPAGGVSLAGYVAREMALDKVLSLDIGGTTAKICFIRGGTPQTTRKFEVARAWRDVKGSGLPIKVPTVELVEIGAGGGSIAGVDGMGRLKVGPKSAGADPGPAAYDQGGTDATITDAHLTVGNLSATGFAGGIIELAPQRAPEAVRTHVQEPLDLADVESAAAGIVELADETMANAARVHGIELGLDISEFDLLVSGGGGGLHGARIAEKLGIRRVIVPANAGVGSAVGFLRAPVAYERALSVSEPIARLEAAHLATRLRDALEDVQTVVEAAVPPDRIEIEVRADIRYEGQGLELTLPLHHQGDLAEALAALAEAFEARYERLVGFRLPDIPVELTAISVKAREHQETVANTTGAPPAALTDHGTRNIYDRAAGHYLPYLEAPRTAVPAEVLPGPAVLPERQTTTLVRPGWTVRASELGHLILQRGAEQ